MSDDPTRNAALDPRFFDGRLLIDILSWDWNYRLAVSPRDRRLSFLMANRSAVIGPSA